MSEPLEHEWFDPGEYFPRLRMISRINGTILLSCKKCMIMKGPKSITKPCPGYRKIELRKEEQ